MGFWNGLSDQAEVDSGRAAWAECPGPGHRPCSHGGRYLIYRGYKDPGACIGCRRDRIAHKKKTWQIVSRIKKRQERVSISPLCEVCSGPLWPEGSTPARARSDRKTCSDRCRQAKRRSTMKAGL